jgi:hypothetical protein
MRKLIVAAVILLAFGGVFAQDDDPAEQRVRELAKAIVEKSHLEADAFTKAFLAAVPTAKLEPVLADMFAKGGKVTSVKRLSGDRLQGKFELEQERGERSEVTIGVEKTAPHRIASLWLKPLGVAARTLGDLEVELRKLPGKVSFAVARLSSRVTTLASVEPDEPLAIGSSFKLYVLGTLIDEVSQGKRHWSDVVTLKPECRSLPSGSLHTWPQDAPVTLHTLASLMISVSDNTATDNLVAVLDRRRIERQLEVMGNARPARSTPFLRTGDMFRLKWGKKENARRWLESDLAGKRALLAELEKEPLPEVSGIAASEPVLISEIEWFASAHDLVRALAWLRDATANDATGRGVLAINNGGMDASAWKWVGFKGGSEPGVLELAWLLERKDGEWFSVSCGWNDPKAAVDTTKLAGIALRAIELVAKPHPSHAY